MRTCIRCGARARQIGIRGTVLWSRAHLGDASWSMLESSGGERSEHCPECRDHLRDETARPAHAWKFWRRPGAEQ